MYDNPLPSAPKTVHYRCGSNSCRQRFVLNKPIENYVRQSSKFSKKQWSRIKIFKCPICYNGNIHDVTKSVRKWNRAITCRCGGTLHYPHSRGSIGCEHGDPDSIWIGSTYSPD